jgi:GT2 family glycosyltransferase
VDESQRVILSFAEKLPALRIVDASERKGTNYARNRGVGQAQASLLAFCDADDVASPKWLESLVTAAANAELVGGPLEYRKLNESDLHQVSWTDHFPAQELVTALDFLPYAPSSNFAIRADVLKALGGWSESYTHGGDDVELCWRAQLAGHRIAFAPDAVMHYRMRRGLRALARQRFSFGRADARLLAEFETAGIPPVLLRDELRVWRTLLADLRGLHDAEARREWLGKLSYRAGRARGTAEHRLKRLGPLLEQLLRRRT